METVSFSVLGLLLLMASCMPDNDYYYHEGPISGGNNRISIQGTVVGIDSLQTIDSAEIRIVFPEKPFDTIYQYSSTTGAFTYLYSYTGNEDFWLSCTPIDTTHSSFSSDYTFSGRDVSSGFFKVDIVLDTL